MVDRRTVRIFFPESVLRIPADLAAMLLVTAMINVAVFVPIVRETPLRTPLGLAFVLFVPGYVFIAALFPEDGSGLSVDDETKAADTGFSEGPIRSGIDWVERLALAFGMSVAIAPLIGLALHFTPWEFRFGPIMVAMTFFTLVATTIAVIRRWELPADDRFRVPYREWYRIGRREVLEPKTRFDGLLNVLLALSILLAVGALGFAVMFPPQGEQFSSIYLLTEDDDGDLVAAGYPTEFVEGQSEELVVGIGNQERETTEYTVVVLEQETESVGNETLVTDQRELDRFEVELEHNESTYHTYTLTPSLIGEDIRVIWLLYEDDVPDTPSPENTEYYVHLWISVNEADD